ncbi:MAG: chemotaxis protein [Candidatus Magnetoovum sp. WYHC-5]|nr:chemotaxis protein [Candidatus Magnetoovum sp. WYHC-5]
MEKDLFSEVQQRTQLAFSNQIEMLVFTLSDNQMYAINVFKIIEVLECPSKVTKLPYAHAAVKGTIDFRGKAVIVIDVSDFLGLVPQDFKNKLSYIIVCEYSTNMQGLLINMPDTLITKSWSDIKSPNAVLNNNGYLTAITYNDKNEMIQLLDIEKMLVEIQGIETKLAEPIKADLDHLELCTHHVLVVDDSKAARIMIEAVLKQLGFTYESFDSAYEALKALDNDPEAERRYCMIICDIEMPGMDGFTFTRMLKTSQKLKDTYILLHSSMSNPTNETKASQAGANGFIAKFQPDVLAKKIVDVLTGKEG